MRWGYASLSENAYWFTFTSFRTSALTSCYDKIFHRRLGAVSIPFHIPRRECFSPSLSPQTLSSNSLLKLSPQTLSSNSLLKLSPQTLSSNSLLKLSLLLHHPDLTLCYRLLLSHLIHFVLPAFYYRIKHIHLQTNVNSHTYARVIMLATSPSLDNQQNDSSILLIRVCCKFDRFHLNCQTFPWMNNWS